MLMDLPEGDGIAAMYPGDLGIEEDPAVILADGFEGCASTADLRPRWSVLYHEDHIRVTEDPANVHSGRKALELTVPRQRAALAIGADRALQDEVDVLFLRWYAKFEEGYFVPGGSVHNGGSISAHYYVDNQATPGKRADGRNKFLANYENENSSGTPPGRLNVYLYHPEQGGNFGDHCYPTGRVVPSPGTPSGPETFGPGFVPRPDVVPQLGRWHCYEYMVKANTPGLRNGRIACWLDGKVVADFPNLRLRDLATLRINRFGLGLFIARNEERANTKWYDDVVAATAYIGPQVAARQRAGGSPSSQNGNSCCISPSSSRSLRNSAWSDWPKGTPLSLRSR
jgi:hypothetical protein